MDAIERGLHRGGIPLEKAASYFIGLKNFGGTSAREEAALAAECVKQAADQAPPKAPIVEEAPADSAATDPHPHLNVKSAALRFHLLANALKKQAADETPPSADTADASLASPTPAEAPPKDDYIANEEAGLGAENAAAVQYYQMQLEQARAETAAAQEQAQSLQMQVDQLTQSQMQHDSQVAAANQEGQIAQQAAMQQIDAANLAASQAMNQAVQASNQALQAKGQEAAAKIEVQSVRSQLFDLASQGLPGTQPELGGEGGAAAGMEPLQPAGAEDPAGAGAEGDPAAAGAEGGEAAPGGGEAAPEGGAGEPDSGMNQAGESASADGMPGGEGATEPAASAAPGAVPPQGEGGSQSGESSPPQSSSDSGGGGSGSSSSDAKRQGQISIKVGSAGERRAQLEQRLPWLSKTASPSLARISKAIDGASDARLGKFMARMNSRERQGVVRAHTALREGRVPQAKVLYQASDSAHAAGSMAGARRLEKARNSGLVQGALGGIGVGVGASRLMAEKEKTKTAGLAASTIGALAGGALGAGAAALEGAGHGPDLEKMRSGVAEREAGPKRTGLRGFADALSLVQEKARLGLGEATQAHPIPATIVGGLGGAALGASAGPRIRDLVNEAAALHRGA